MSQNRTDDPLEAFPPEGARVLSLISSTDTAPPRDAGPDARRFHGVPDTTPSSAPSVTATAESQAALELQHRLLAANRALARALAAHTVELRRAAVIFQVVGYGILGLGLIQVVVFAWTKRGH